MTAVISVALSGCSSRPRSFAPTLSAPPADQAALDRAIADCQALFVAGKLDSNGRLASAGAAAGVGATTVVAGGATAAAVAGYGGLAVASATIVLLPFAIVGGAIGMSKMKRARKEKAIKAAMGGCLQERGFAVQGWTRSPQGATATVGTPADSSVPAPRN
ncbi:MAG: hypothetical protein ABIO29_00100 [Sphingomicrobium sp.]